MMSHYTHHDKTTDPKKNQVAPFFSIGRKEKPYPWQNELHDKTDNGAPYSEVIHRYEWVGSFADPAYGGKRNDSTANAQHGYCYCLKTLFGGDVIVVRSVRRRLDRRGNVCAWHHVAVARCRRCFFTRRREEGGRACDKKHASKGYHCSDFLDTSEWFLYQY